jgi:hypothetical protein
MQCPHISTGIGLVCSLDKDKRGSLQAFVAREVAELLAPLLDQGKVTASVTLTEALEGTRCEGTLTLTPAGDDSLTDESYSTLLTRYGSAHRSDQSRLVQADVAMQSTQTDDAQASKRARTTSTNVVINDDDGLTPQERAEVENLFKDCGIADEFESLLDDCTDEIDD